MDVSEYIYAGGIQPYLPLYMILLCNSGATTECTNCLACNPGLCIKVKLLFFTFIDRKEAVDISESRAIDTRVHWDLSGYF